VARKTRTLRSAKSNPALPLSVRPKKSMAKSAQQRISRFSRFKLRVSSSRIHRLGVFAAENIPARTRVIEYCGRKLNRRPTNEVFNERWASRSPNLYYLARVDTYWAVDGAIDGSGAEFVNHSCDPNLIMMTIRKRIWLVSLRRVRRGEELSYDYSFDPRAIRVPCHCHSPKCRGTLNRI
jgi:uncharacterized protein